MKRFLISESIFTFILSVNFFETHHKFQIYTNFWMNSIKLKMSSTKD